MLVTAIFRSQAVQRKTKTDPTRHIGKSTRAHTYAARKLSSILDDSVIEVGPDHRVVTGVKVEAEVQIVTEDGDRALGPDLRDEVGIDIATTMTNGVVVVVVVRDRLALDRGRAVPATAMTGAERKRRKRKRRTRRRRRLMTTAVMNSAKFAKRTNSELNLACVR